MVTCATTIRLPAVLSLLPALSVALCTVSVSAADKEPTGELLYKTQCASCHGEAGEGTKKHKRQLVGDKSLSQLADVIRETMPEDDPGSLSEKQAAAIAGYIHDAFYSRIARERNRPARVDLARLTVRQYRAAVADVIGSFREPAKWGDIRGLNGEYNGGRPARRNRGGGPEAPRQNAKRVDATVNFDFGTGPPAPGIAEGHNFSIRWTGSVLAPETGEFEFLVRTEHAVQLFVNDMRKPLIDALVKSGNEIEYKANLNLVGGRAYPLRLEFTKSKQGVDDSKDQKEQPPSMQASIALMWKRPHREAEVIPAWYLSPGSAPEAFVCATAFPPDDRSYGWERGTFVSKAWDQSTTEAAMEVLSYVFTHINELANTSDGATDRADKLREFCRKFASRAFRRTLTDDLSKTFIDTQFAAAPDADTAAKRALLLVLKSPRLLYRDVDDVRDQYDVAAELSFGLWNSLPDRELLDAAAAGKLATREQVTQQAERMLGDPRARTKLREFLLTWLKADAIGEMAKDAEKFPDFDSGIVADLRTSLEMFLDDVVWSEGSDFRKLVLADEVFANDRLAVFYGLDLPADSDGDFAKVKVRGDWAAGVLTHPYLMASFADSRESSPIHRGVFLARGLLGQALRPPPEAVAPLAAELHPSLSTRERVTMQTKPAACSTCHGIINPLGFALEHFDAVGRYREQDRGKPVDSTGSYQTRDGNTVTLDGSRALGQFLAGCDETHSSFVEQLFHHLVQQPVRAYGPTRHDELQAAFSANSYNIRKLAVEMMVDAALFRPTAELANHSGEQKK